MIIVKDPESAKGPQAKLHVREEGGRLRIEIADPETNKPVPGTPYFVCEQAQHYGDIAAVCWHLNPILEQLMVPKFSSAEAFAALQEENKQLRAELSKAKSELRKAA